MSSARGALLSLGSRLRLASARPAGRSVRGFGACASINPRRHTSSLLGASSSIDQFGWRRARGNDSESRFFYDDDDEGRAFFGLTLFSSFVDDAASEGHGVTHEGVTLHDASFAHKALGTGFGAMMWFWVFYRFYHDGDVLLYGHAPHFEHDDHDDHH